MSEGHGQMDGWVDGGMEGWVRGGKSTMLAINIQQREPGEKATVNWLELSGKSNQDGNLCDKNSTLFTYTLLLGDT